MKARPTMTEEEIAKWVRARSATEDSAGGYVLTAQAQGNAPGEKRQRDKTEPSSAAPCVRVTRTKL